MNAKEALESLLRKTNQGFISEEIKTLKKAIEVLGILRKNAVVFLEDDGRTQENYVFSGIDFEDVQNKSEEDWDKVLEWMEDQSCLRNN